MVEIEFDVEANRDFIKPYKPYRDYQVDSSNRPTSAPRLKDNQALIAAYDMYIRVKYFLCQGLPDMQILYDSYHAGGASSVNFFGVEDFGLYIPPHNPEQ